MIMNIAFRDFRSLVFSPVFLFLCGLFSCFWSYQFPRQLIAFAMNSGANKMNIHFSLFASHFSNTLFMIMVIVPVISMRLLCEEKKQRTYDLIMTSPVTATNIVLGKFIAGLLAVICFLLVSFIYPIMTTFLVDFYWGPTLATVFGLILLCGFFVSIGLFCSALTSSTLISILMGFMMIFMFWVVGQGQAFSDNPLVVDLSQQFSVSQHISSFMYGKISLAGVVFFVSMTSFFIFLSQRLIESTRWRS